jgi:hypothetical protein
MAGDPVNRTAGVTAGRVLEESEIKNDFYFPFINRIYLFYPAWFAILKFRLLKKWQRLSVKDIHS